MTIWHELASAAPTEEQSFRIASLRLFLRCYQELRPEVVAELISRVLPAFRDVFTKGGDDGRQEAFQTALESWMDEFYLPKSSEMAEEAVLTLLFPSPSGRLVFAWDSIQESLKAQKILKFKHSLPFAFQALGWTPAEESIEEAASRLRDHFKKALSEHLTAWQKYQRSGANLPESLKRDKAHIRNIRWLAQKQACPNVSLEGIRKQSGCKIRTVLRGVQAAAECLRLPLERIRKARAGRKPGRLRSV